MFCRSVINQDPALLKRLEMTGVIFRVYVLSLSPSLLSLPPDMTMVKLNLIQVSTSAAGADAG